MLAEEQIIVRPAALSDIPELVTLIRRSWLVTWAPELPFAAVQHFALNDPADDYGSTMWPSFQVAMRDDRLLAMVHVADDRIAAIHVDPTVKGRGTGTRLMDWAELRVRENIQSPDWKCAPSTSSPSISTAVEAGAKSGDTWTRNAAARWRRWRCTSS